MFYLCCVTETLPRSLCDTNTSFHTTVTVVQASVCFAVVTTEAVLFVFGPLKGVKTTGCSTEATTPKTDFSFPPVDGKLGS